MIKKNKKRFIEIGIFGILFIIFFFTASGNIDSIDGTTHISLARELIVNRRMDFGVGPLAKSLNTSINETTGKYYTYYNFGYSLFFIPGVLASIGIRNILNVPLPDFPLQPDWILISYANMVNGAAIAFMGVLLYRLIMRVQKNKSNNQIFAVLIPILILSTHLFIEAHNHFPHPIFTLFFLLSFYYLIQRKMSKFSLMFLITASIYNITFIFLLPSLYVYYLLPYFKKGFRIIIKHISFMTIYILPAFLMQGIWNYIRYMNIGYTGYSENVVFSASDIFARIWGMTFAPNMGIFINNPILVLAVIFAVRNLYKKNLLKNISIFFLVLSGSYIFGYSLSNLWHASTVYGPRFHTPILPVGILLLCLQWRSSAMNMKLLLSGLIGVGLLVQIPGILIPNFAFPFLSPSYCMNYTERYYNPQCAPIKVGWSNLIKRRVKETLITMSAPMNKNKISLIWPQPPQPFRTIYPDPLFDKFSTYTVSQYKIPKTVYNDLYSFALDLWWIKLRYYKNIGI